MLALVHLASLFDVCLMVAFGILIYSRKQSLDQRPKACMSHFGQPAAAAVEAAPMRREWEEMLAMPSVVASSKELISFRDR